MEIGSRLCQHSLQVARRLRFRAMQFNLVVSTNTAGLRCWQRNGFQVVGTLPGAFRHRQFGDVDALVMLLGLVDAGHGDRRRAGADAQAVQQEAAQLVQRLPVHRHRLGPVQKSFMVAQPAAATVRSPPGALPHAGRSAAPGVPSESGTAPGHGTQRCRPCRRWPRRHSLLREIGSGEGAAGTETAGDAEPRRSLPAMQDVNGSSPLAQGVALLCRGLALPLAQLWGCRFKSG